MPTIEIASINSTGLNLKQADFEIAIIEEDKLESHRGLFYDFLKNQSGIIVHIGNPVFKDDKGKGFFAGQIIDWSAEPAEIFFPQDEHNHATDNGGANQQYRFKFLDKYKTDVDRILKIALAASPIKKVYFLTDYQFGPEKENLELIYTISDFWTRHDNEGLIFNTMYELYGQ